MLLILLEPFAEYQVQFYLIRDPGLNPRAMEIGLYGILTISTTHGEFSIPRLKPRILKTPTVLFLNQFPNPVYMLIKLPAQSNNTQWQQVNLLLQWFTKGNQLATPALVFIRETTKQCKDRSITRVQLVKHVPLCLVIIQQTIYQPFFFKFF